MYILDDESCNPICLAYNTNDILIENYIFPDENTIKNNINNYYIIIEEHKSLLQCC